MKLRNKLDDYEYEAELTTEHSVSSYGQPVLVDVATGEAIDQVSASCSVLVSATRKERKALRAAGYFLQA